MYEPFFLFLYGFPGSSSQRRQIASTLHDRLGITYLASVSVGEWLKQQAEAQHTLLGSYVLANWNDDALEPLATHYVQLVCADFVNQVRQRCVDGTPSALIISGYPRTRTQAEALAQVCNGHYFYCVELASSDSGDNLHYQRRLKGIHAALPKRCLWRKYSSDVSDAADALCHATYEWVADQSAQMQRLPIPPPPAPQRMSAILTKADAVQSAEVVQRMLQLANATRSKRHFPGAQPVSLLREHLPRLHRYPYMVSLKADGERWFCVVHESSLWFVTRSLQVFRSVYRPALEQHNGTLLDGEYVAARSLFLVLDCLAVQGRNVCLQPLMERLELSVPLGQLFADGSQPLWFRPQEYVDVRTRFSELLQKSAQRPFALDGLVFTPAKLPYRLGIDFNMFKWKPAAENTVDLLFLRGSLFCRQTRRSSGTTSAAVVAEDEVDYAADSAPRSHLAAIGSLAEKCVVSPGSPTMVLECSLVGGETPENYVWRPRRLRPDKRGPNLDWIVESIVQSIRENITLEELQAELMAKKPAPSAR